MNDMKPLRIVKKRFSGYLDVSLSNDFRDEAEGLRLIRIEGRIPVFCITYAINGERQTMGVRFYPDSEEKFLSRDLAHLSKAQKEVFWNAIPAIMAHLEEE